MPPVWRDRNLARISVASRARSGKADRVAYATDRRRLRHPSVVRGPSWQQRYHPV